MVLPLRSRPGIWPEAAGRPTILSAPADRWPHVRWRYRARVGGQARKAYPPGLRGATQQGDKSAFIPPALTTGVGRTD